MSDSATSWTVAPQAPLSLRFSRQEHWSGFPFPSPRDLLSPGTEPGVSCLGRWFLYRWVTREAWFIIASSRLRSLSKSVEGEMRQDIETPELALAPVESWERVMWVMSHWRAAPVEICRGCVQSRMLIQCDKLVLLSHLLMQILPSRRKNML